MSSQPSPAVSQESFDAVYGSDWPIRLRVFVPGLRKPVGVVKSHPLDPKAYYWEGHIERTRPSGIDPRPWRPAFGRIDRDPRWNKGALPARGPEGVAITIPRPALLAALANGDTKHVHRPSVHNRPST